MCECVCHFLGVGEFETYTHAARPSSPTFALRLQHMLRERPQLPAPVRVLQRLGLGRLEQAGADGRCQRGLGVVEVGVGVARRC